MKILRLRLRHMIGIKKGLGLDELDLDLSQISGLCAFSGENGAGKSSVLESLQIFPRLASRKGALQQHYYGRNGYRELEFEFHDDNYKILIKVDSEANRTEGYAWKNGESLLDGKISNYSKWCVKLLGSPELFFNSVFCSQSARKINDFTTGELKSLFSEFLRLDKLITFETTAKQCTNLLTDQAEKLKRELEVLKEGVDTYNEVKTNLVIEKTNKQSHEQNLAELANDHALAVAKLAEAQLDINENNVIRTRVKGLRDSLDRIEKEIKADNEQSKTELDDLRSKIRTINLEIVSLVNLLTNESKIKEAADRVKVLSLSITANRALLEASTNDYLAASKLVSKEEKIKSDCSLAHGKLIGALKNSRDQLSLQIKQARLGTADLDKRDPKCKSSTCSFIVSALRAQGSIPKLEAELAEDVDSISDAEKAYADTLNESNANIEALRKQETDISIEKRRLGIKITELETELKEIQSLADELPKIDTARSKKDDLEKRQTELTDEGIKIKDVWDLRIANKKDQQAEEESAIKTEEAKINKEAERDLSIILHNIELLKSSIAERTDAITDLSATILSLEKEVAQKEQAKKDYEVKTIERDRIIVEASEWEYLKNACGKDGLRALEIDSVAPVVTGYANDLLLSTFGPSYAVKFRTQDEETGRELLDILVISDTGDEILLDMLSGGQKIWILNALRLSLTLISNKKSGKNFLSGFADELDGSLDIKHAIEFVQMYRAFMKAGGFESFYFISHKPETIALADHVLSFGNGEIK